MAHWAVTYMTDSRSWNNDMVEISIDKNVVIFRIILVLHIF